MPGVEPLIRLVVPRWTARSDHRSHSHTGPLTPSLQMIPNPLLPQFLEILGKKKKNENDLFEQSFSLNIKNTAAEEKNKQRKYGGVAETGLVLFSIVAGRLTSAIVA